MDEEIARKLKNLDSVFKALVVCVILNLILSCYIFVAQSQWGGLFMFLVTLVMSFIAGGIYEQLKRTKQKAKAGVYDIKK